MFTEKALLKAKIDLFNIISNHSMQDYLQANFKNGKRKSKKHIPYSTSADTDKAREINKILFNADITDITPEQEEQIKGFLLVYRTTRTEYLKEGYKGGNWYYKEQLENLE
jgi:outer membrane protein OmpA-like peptidoglycan-associated protein